MTDSHGCHRGQRSQTRRLVVLAGIGAASLILLTGIIPLGSPASAAPMHRSSADSRFCRHIVLLVRSCGSPTDHGPALFIQMDQIVAVLASGMSLAGFGIIVSNSSTTGTGVANQVALKDALPADDGIDWLPIKGYSGPGHCAVRGKVGSQVLTCRFGRLKPGKLDSVGVLTEVNDASPGTFPNVATASAANAPSVSASSELILNPTSKPSVATPPMSIPSR